MRVLSGLVRLTAALLIRLVKAGLLVAIVAGIPYGLLTQIGPPLPDRLPANLDHALHALTAPVSDTLVLHVLALALWVLWAAFLVCLVVEVAAAIRGVPAPRLRLVAPIQTLAGWLVAGVTASVLIAAPVVSVAGHATPAVATAQPATATASAATTDPAAAATAIPVAAHRATQTHLPVYEVAHGDWMVDVAERFLGDKDRYVDIEALNPQWERRDDRFPDHWEPGWRVVLPADAHDRGPRPHATGHFVTAGTPAPPAEQPPGGQPVQPGPEPSDTPSTSPTTRPSASPTPSATASTPADPDGVVPEPRTPPSSAGTAGPSSGATGSPTPSASSDAPANAPDTDEGQGVDLPGGWLGLPLAAALVAAAAMVWRRRRHRYVPRPVRDEPLDDPDLPALPPVVNRLRHAVREQAADLLDPPAEPRQPTVADYANADTDEFELPPVGPSGVDLAGMSDQVPAGGLGLTGPGAEPAARALLVATLSTGSPADPDARGQVVIPADALTTLLGAHSVEIGAIPRLSVTPTLSEALTRVEELLIERRRQLQDYDAADLPELRAADPYHPPMPPVLLLAEVPPPESRARLSTTLHLGTPLQISAVLLGEWPRGDTATVRTDGHTTGGDGQRLAVLDVPTTMQLLHVLCEAHTGQPAPSAQPTPDPDTHTAHRQTDGAPVPGQPDDEAPVDTTATATDAAEPDAGEPIAHGAEPGAAEAPAADPIEQPAPAAEPADEHATAEPDATEPAPPPRPRRRQPVRIHLLGEPTILDRDGTAVSGLRRHARQLLVYLAVHRDGADLNDIMEAFWPTATVRRAGERLSTEVANLRGRIRQAAGDDKIEPVINTGGRYVLNTDVLDIDLWRMSDALRRVGTATDPTRRISALRHAVDVHTGGLADGHDYDWIEQPREQIRRHGVRARLHLANLLADHDPTQAATLAQAAADLDGYNEDAAQHAMKTLARIGDAAGIRSRLQRLRDALDEIDEEPSGETIALAAQLQRQISGKAGRRGREHRPDTGPHSDGDPPRTEP